MSQRGKLENMNLSGIEVNAEGDSVVLHLVGMVPPYEPSRFECCNVYSFAFHRSPDERVPFYVGELEWHELEDAEKQTILEKTQYPILDERGGFFVSKAKIVCVHLEGGLCADILAEKVAHLETRGVLAETESA